MRFAIEGLVAAVELDPSTRVAETICIRIARAWDRDGQPVQRLREPAFRVAPDGTMRFALGAFSPCHAEVGMSVRLEFEPEVVGNARALHLETLEPM